MNNEDKKFLETLTGYTIEDILDDNKWKWYNFNKNLYRNTCLKTLFYYFLIYERNNLER